MTDKANTQKGMIFHNIFVWGLLPIRIVSYSITQLSLSPELYSNSVGLYLFSFVWHLASIALLLVFWSNFSEKTTLGHKLLIYVLCADFIQGVLDGYFSLLLLAGYLFIWGYYNERKELFVNSYVVPINAQSGAISELQATPRMVYHKYLIWFLLPYNVFGRVAKLILLMFSVSDIVDFLIEAVVLGGSAIWYLLTWLHLRKMTSRAIPLIKVWVTITCVNYCCDALAELILRESAFTMVYGLLRAARWLVLAVATYIYYNKRRPFFINGKRLRDNKITPYSIMTLHSETEAVQTGALITNTNLNVAVAASPQVTQCAASQSLEQTTPINTPIVADSPVVIKPKVEIDTELPSEKTVFGISFCRHCGKKLEAGSKFCNRCGKQVTWEE